MGFDLCGWSKKGGDTYFRNNMSWWCGLWGYVSYVCQFTEEIIKGGFFNDGLHINGDKTKEIMNILKEEIRSGRTQTIEQKCKDHNSSLADIKCTLCNGTGIMKRSVEGEGELCLICNGRGIVKDSEGYICFSVKNVLNFIDFLEESDGGFEIW